MSNLAEKEPKKNFSQVFKASDKENIARCIDYTDFSNKETPDQLLIMTFLFQLRDHFTESKSKNASFNSSIAAMLSPFKSASKKKQPQSNSPNANTSTPNRNTSENLNYRNPFESDPDETEEDLSSFNKSKSKSIRQDLSVTKHLKNFKLINWLINN